MVTMTTMWFEAFQLLPILKIYDHDVSRPAWSLAEQTLEWFLTIWNNGIFVRAITDTFFYTDLIGTMIEIN